MTNTHRCLGALVIALLFGMPSAASAQQLPDWTMGIQLGKPLFVTLQNGDRLEGVAGSVGVNGIEVATPVGVRLAPYGDIRMVKKRDSIWNGVWTGVGVGFGIGLMAALSEDCDSVYNNQACHEMQRAIPMAGAIWGGLIGWGIDAAVKGRSTVFQSNGSGPKVSFNATPKGVSARLSVAW